MSIRAGAVCLAIACSLWACTAPAPEPAPEPAAAPAAETVGVIVDDAGEEIMLQAVIAPTEDMLKAALANDPDAMREAATASLTGCQAASTCPTSYGSCSSWSTPTQCGSECGIGICRCTPVWECEPEIKGSESYNSYRVCFNSSGQSCTEFSQTTYTTCGC